MLPSHSLEKISQQRHCIIFLWYKQVLCETIFRFNCVINENFCGDIIFPIYIFARRSIRKYKPNSLTSQNFPTDAPRGFHVETTWKRPWNPRGVFVGLYWSTWRSCKIDQLYCQQMSWLTKVWLTVIKFLTFLSGLWRAINLAWGMHVQIWI